MDYYVDGKLDRGGVLTDKRAREYSEQHRCDYATALRTVIKESNRAHVEKINRAAAKYEREHGSLPDGWRIYEDSTGSILEIELKDAGQAIPKLSALVAGLPRLSDGSVDVQLALKIIRSEFSDLGKESAGGFLFHQAKKIMLNSEPIEAMDLPSALKRAQAKFPDISSVYNGSAMSEASLKTILLPLFKSEQTPPAPGERSYQRPRVKSYLNENEFWRYEYTPERK